MTMSLFDSEWSAAVFCQLKDTYRKTDLQQLQNDVLRLLAQDRETDL